MPGSASTESVEPRTALARALFAPERIALIGAMPHQDLLTSRPQRVLKRLGYPGAIVPINPRYGEICGDRAFPSVRGLPWPIDHAFIMVPATAVATAIDDCCSAGIPVATILSAGFAEAGAAGGRRQQRIVAAAHAAGVRLLGPNSLGLVNVPGRVTLCANAVFDEEGLRPGGLSVVSQSGSMLGAILTRAQERGLGFAKLVSVGNECDIRVGELVDLLVEDAHTRAILLFLEVFRDAPVLAAAARRAYSAGKPVIALKLGRSPSGQAIARSHTGALAGEDAAARAYLHDHGILSVDTLEALFETAQLVLGHRPRRTRRVAAMTVSGGAAAMVVDRLGLANIGIVAPPAALAARLAARGIRIGDRTVIDLPMGRADGGAYAAILGELMASDHCDAVLAVLGSAVTHTPQVVAERILAARIGAKPLAVFAGPRAGEALRLLQDGGVAGFRTPEACADALRAYCEWRSPSAPVAVPPHVLDHFAAAVRACARGPLDAWHSIRLLSAIGIPCAATRLVRNAGDAADLPYPVAVKVLSTGLAHKTEAAGVELDIEGPQALAQAAERMLARVRRHAPEAQVDGLLVQPMQRGIGEVMIGFRRDREVGPVILAGVGGVLAELWAQCALRLAPVDVATALEMIEEVRGLAAIRGYRNRPKGDAQAVAQVIHRLSLLALVDTPAVTEAEINPLIVGEQGAAAVDARVVIEPD